LGKNETIKIILCIIIIHEHEEFRSSSSSKKFYEKKFVLKISGYIRIIKMEYVWKGIYGIEKNSLKRDV